MHKLIKDGIFALYACVHKWLSVSFVLGVVYDCDNISLVKTTPNIGPPDA